MMIPIPAPPSCKDDDVETFREGPYDGCVPPPPSAAACAESAAAYAESVAASALSAASSAERASAAADRAAAAAKTAAAAAMTAAANTESARAVVRAADVALARVEAIHAKIFQATSDSSMQPMSEKAAVAMEHLLPHEISEQRREEELRVAKVEVKKSLPVEESAMEYQRELWRSHYYEYYNLEGGAEDKDEGKSSTAESYNGSMSPGQVIDVSSHTGDA